MRITRNNVTIISNLFWSTMVDHWINQHFEWMPFWWRTVPFNYRKYMDISLTNIFWWVKPKLKLQLFFEFQVICAIYPWAIGCCWPWGWGGGLEEWCPPPPPCWYGWCWFIMDCGNPSPLFPPTPAEWFLWLKWCCSWWFIIWFR